jgi:hypothetical protein
LTVVIKKISDGSARVTSRGVEVVQVFQAKETGGTVINDAPDALSLIHAINSQVDAGGTTIPEEGESREFTLPNGNTANITCRQVIVRKLACNVARFQCWFSTFSYWSGPGTPTNPDPRVVFLSTGFERVDEVAKFEWRVLEPEGGTGTVERWIPTSLIPIDVNTGTLRVRCYLPDGISEAQVQFIYARIQQIHTISGEKWRFDGADISESAGGAVTGDPVFITYKWTGENGNGPFFAGDDAVAELWTIPARDGFYRYRWYIDQASQTPVVETYLPSPYEDVPNGWEDLPGLPILGGVPN